jgi:3-phosphoshikimate 1-carboxyvinyltransferase
MRDLKNIFTWGLFLIPDSLSDSFTVEPWPSIKKTLVSVKVRVAPDKSLTHRAIMFAALANGKSYIKNPLSSHDCLATMGAFEKFGVKFKTIHSSDDGHSESEMWEVSSQGSSTFDGQDVGILDLGNSGTSVRLLMGLLAGRRGLKATLTGDHSLRKRPMARVSEPLANMGAKILAPLDQHTLPLTITGQKLRPVTHEIHVASAQVKSALLLAGMQAVGETRITLPIGSRDHTERMLESFGAIIKKFEHNGLETLSIQGPFNPSPFHFHVPADPSSLAFFAVLAALHPGLEISASDVLYNGTRIGLYVILEKIGVKVEWKNHRSTRYSCGETVADVVISRRPLDELSAVEISPHEVALMIDEIPILSVLLAMIDGRSVIHGVSELRAKESDRLGEIIKLLTAAGREAQMIDDSLVINGANRLFERIDYAGEDHRLLMSAIILATKASESSKVAGVSWIATSFPLFLDGFQNINTLFKSF